jgi:hypothetical protein
VFTEQCYVGFSLSLCSVFIFPVIHYRILYRARVWRRLDLTFCRVCVTVMVILKFEVSELVKGEVVGCCF